MINRSQSPAFKEIEDINFIQPENKKLDNGIPLFVINADEQNLLRIEFVFNNINWNENKPLQAISVNSLLTNGTTQLTAQQIAEKVDYYGAFLQSDYTADYITVTLYTLEKYLNQVLPIVKSVLTESIFPEEEVSIFIRNQKQKLQVNLQKNDFLGRKKFANALFGNTNYGFDVNENHYDAIQQNDLLSYFKTAFVPDNCTIFVAGKFKSESFDAVNQFFGANWGNSISKNIENNFNFLATKGQKIFVEKSEAIQSAIRIGQLSVNRKHADFAALQVLNCVLGGYFGSRLMANIREEKGYTYGIGSALVSMKNVGYFFIATEVGAEVRKQTLAEIEKEISILKNDKILDNELKLVRNYMLGSLLGSLENAFSHIDKFKNIYLSGLGYDYYDNYIHTVKNVDADRLQTLANKYLNTSDFVEVVVGK